MLVTGVKSGFGKYVHERLAGFGLHRGNSENLDERGYDIIVHCAATRNVGVKTSILHPYIEDNLMLTQRLLRIPHKILVYISSVDVYPKTGERYSEDDEINLNEVDNLYGITKLMSEALIRQSSPSHLILRCSGLLGPYMKKNTILRMIEDEKPKLGLTADSQINSILYEDLFEFILGSTTGNIRGTYNVASASNISLLEVARMLGKEVDFGGHFYTVGNFSNAKAAELRSSFRRSSSDTIREFVAQR